MKKHFVILVIVGFLLYLPSLKGPFLWDDEDFIYANKYVKNFQIDKFFTESQTAGRGKLSNYYRPIPQIVYATTHAIFGFNPFWFHLMNVLAHTAAAYAIFYFFYKLTKIAHWSLLIALFFVVHPVQTEAVSYISGLSDPLFVFFGFLSLIYFPQKKSLLFFILCLLSKETGIIFLPLLFLFNLTCLKRIILFFIVTASYLLYHFTFINQFDTTSAWGNTPYANSVTIRLLTFVQNLYTYFALLIFPKDLFMERDYSIHIQTSFYHWSFILSLILFPLIFYLVRKSKLLIFCFLAFFISFIPYTGIVLINGIFYEHFLYLPLVFFFAFLILLVPKSSSTLLISLTLLTLFTARNVIRQFDWLDPVRFYSQTLSHAPQSIRIQNGLAMAYSEMGNEQLAIQQYNNAIHLNPKVPNLYHNLANVYLAQGNLKLAEENYQKALEVDPNFFFSAQSLTVITTATVNRVVDGDTVIIELAGQKVTVRVIGINSPELETHQCMATAAAQLAQKTLNNQAVTINSEPNYDDQDQYHRLLRYITLPDKSDFGATMISSGLARQYDFGGKNYKFRDQYKSLEQKAKESKLGLWLCL